MRHDFSFNPPKMFMWKIYLSLERFFFDCFVIFLELTPRRIEMRNLLWYVALVESKVLVLSGQNFFSSPLHKVMLYSYPSLLAFEWQSIFYSPPLHSVSDDWSFLRPPWKPWISPKKSSNRPPLPPLHIYPPLPSREKSSLVPYLIVTAIYSPNETDWQTPSA